MRIFISSLPPPPYRSETEGRILNTRQIFNNVQKVSVDDAPLRSNPRRRKISSHAYGLRFIRGQILRFHETQFQQCWRLELISTWCSHINMLIQSDTNLFVSIKTKTSLSHVNKPNYFYFLWADIHSSLVATTVAGFSSWWLVRDYSAPVTVKSVD